jgi:hypothetical protein
MKIRNTAVCALIFLLVILISGSLSAQSLKFGGQVGYGMPQGDLFKATDGEDMAKGGFSLDFDALYFLEQFNDKLGLGINYNTSLLFGNSSSNDWNIGVYGLSLYGVRVYYKFFDCKVTPYASLSTGLTRLSTPEISDSNNNVLVESEKSFSFGLRPEIGLDLGGFVLSAAYIVPMKYGSFESKAGVFQISLGVRYTAF